MVKELILFDNLSDEGRHQEMYDPDENKCLFSVSDLYECPEDAIISRGLCDGENAFSLIEIGMEYSKKGYSSINLTCVETCDNEDMDEFIEEYLKKWKKKQK